MRAHHEIDVACGNARRRQRAHIGIVGFHIPIRTRRPRLVVTDAAVDQNGVMRRLHHIGLKTQDQHVLRIERGRLPHPRPVFRQQVRRQAGQHLQCRQEGGFLLDDAVDGETADGELKAHGNSCRLEHDPIRLRRLSSPPRKRGSRGNREITCPWVPAFAGMTNQLVGNRSSAGRDRSRWVDMPVPPAATSLR